MVVANLLPGIKIGSTVPGEQPATYITHTPHPLYPGLCLVIWRLGDGTWSHDALSASQDVGMPTGPADWPTRRGNLRAALHGAP